MKKVNVAIVGASGYTGDELKLILARHPNVHITYMTGFSSVGETVDLHGDKSREMKLTPLDDGIMRGTDAIFACLPHGEAAMHVPKWLEAGKIVFDLSADFRLNDKKNYVDWYGKKHPAPELLKKAVYGMPEIYAKEIKKASLVACPGCYPTATILGMLPAFKNGLVKPNLFVSAVSGTSGAGKKSDLAYSFCEVNENLRAYSVPKHRHTPEMEQELSKASRKKIKIGFVPHLGPFNRGIYATIAADLARPVKQEHATKIYRKFYEKSPFVRTVSEIPQLKNVRGTNYCHINPIVDERTGRLIVISALDNLVKGAAGQAVQCFNIRFGFKEGTALNLKPV
ncbi:MAG: N-acetyl-gamma-glutamyl-phosphate reductase [Nitrospinae bacterium]|nr:N-acetyl-gamma-glutamyl-phosphate reductase [Nitrospinota bacterium]